MISPPIQKRLESLNGLIAGRRRPAIQTVAVAIGLVVLVAAVGGVYYFAFYSTPSSPPYFQERILIEIGGAYYNATDPASNTPASYYPSNFNVSSGAHVTLFIQNEDNFTHGLAVPHFNVDTGAMKPGSNTTLSFVASPVGNYSYYEPRSDCGGGSCDANQSLVGWFLVVP